MPLRRPLILVVCLLLALFASSSARAQQSPAPAACGTENLLARKAPWQTRGNPSETAFVTDGTVGAEGARWDSPFAARLDGHRSALIYDLGEPRRVEAVYLQADANDTYKVMGSLDGSPNSYRLLVELPMASDRGHGLRTRSAKIAPSTVRYLLIGDAVGDDAYSISEFAAYCTAPTPFPPVFASTGSSLTPPTGFLASEVDEARDPPSTQSTFLFAAAALALVGATGVFERRRKRKPAPSAPREPAKSTGKSQRLKKRETEESATDASEPPARAPEKPAQGISLHRLLCVLFVASGAAALIYEVIWMHLLRLVIGASAMSVGIVLASFMGGMFLGSLLFARFVPADRPPLRVYALLEIGIGAFGLLMPLLLPLVRYLYVGLVGYGTLGIAFRALIAMVLLLPPTALMGATLPAIARRYAGGHRAMSGLAALYASNTLGAVLGSLLAAFYLMAVWDVWIATIVAAALNFTVGAVALRYAKHEPAAAPPTTAPVEPTARQLSAVRAVYVGAALSGLTALGAQVVWTRLLTLLFGATVYAFAIILAVFLFSLGTGSALAAYLLRRGKNALNGLAWTQLALIPCLLWAGFLLARVLPLASPPALTPIRALHVLHVLRALEVIFPAAFLWGMSFPFALAAAAQRSADPGRSSGYVYAANTVGAIIGALAVSFWIIPAFGTHWAERTIVLISGISAAFLFYVAPRLATPARRLEQRSVREPVRLSPAWALAACAAAAAVLPGPSTAFLAHGRYVWWVDPKDQYPYVHEGAASTVAVHVAPSGYRNFHVSGRVEATNNPNDLRLERLLGHLSALAHPRPESVLVVGLGAGITAGSFLLHPEVRRIVICEIEPRVVGAAAEFAAENYGVLENPRVEVVFDDARHFLATTREKFDVVTSDPIHPWVRGNSILFSREYYQIVRDRLKPGGVATQWVPLYETSERAIQIQMRTFMDAFPEGTVWNSSATGNGYDVVLLGRELPLRFDLAEIQRRLTQTPSILESLREVRISSAADLVSTYATRGRDMARWLQGVPVNHDFSLKLEYISGLALNRDEADPIFKHMTADREYPSNLFVASPAEEDTLRRRLAANKPMQGAR